MVLLIILKLQFSHVNQFYIYTYLYMFICIRIPYLPYWFSVFGIEIEITFDKFFWFLSDQFDIGPFFQNIYVFFKSDQANSVFAKVTIMDELK